MICRYKYCTNETDGEIKFCSEACYYAFMKVPVPTIIGEVSDENINNVRLRHVREEVQTSGASPK